MATPLKARAVLADCHAAYRELRETADPPVYRRRWLAMVTLLRAVGHVLDKIDGDRDADHRRVIDVHWQADKPDVFTHFIEETRSNTIKEYRSGARLKIEDRRFSPMAVYDATAMSVSDATPGLSADDDFAKFVPESLADLSAPLPFVFGDGPFERESVYTVIERALSFWDDYLKAIESDLGLGSG